MVTPALHEGAGPDQDPFVDSPFLIEPPASCSKTRATKAPGSTSGEARRRLWR